MLREGSSYGVQGLCLGTWMNGIIERTSSFFVSAGDDNECLSGIFVAQE